MTTVDHTLMRGSKPHVGRVPLVMCSDLTEPPCAQSTRALRPSWKMVLLTCRYVSATA